jgi:hypothetical protein
LLEITLHHPVNMFMLVFCVVTPWRWRQYVSPKRWCLSTSPHDVKPRRPTSTSSPTWEPQISYVISAVWGEKTIINIDFERFEILTENADCGLVPCCLAPRGLVSCGSYNVWVLYCVVLYREGLVLCGLVPCGFVLCGLVRCGSCTVWSCTVWVLYRVVLYCVVLYRVGLVPRGLVPRGLVLCGLVPCGSCTVWSCTVWFCTVWSCTVWVLYCVVLYRAVLYCVVLYRVGLVPCGSCTVWSCTVWVLYRVVLYRVGLVRGFTNAYTGKALIDTALQRWTERDRKWNVPERQR